ncbi:MAG: type II secretion system minor pseudopilin GspI [Glaciecola sp.]
MMKRLPKGFTLIEVMVAVGIFAIAGAAVMKATFEHLRSISTLEEITFATWVANNQLTDTTLRAQIQWPPKNNAKGEASLAGRKWYWQQTFAKTQDDNLFQITIVVASDENMNNEITGVTTFISKGAE